LNKILRYYETATKYPLGRKAFSKVAARMAPYFSSISPVILTLEPNRCEVLLRKRKAVENHIGTVHVIAIANGLEMAMGIMAEASVPTHLRWIPKGMTLSYPAKAGSDITCSAIVSPEAWTPGDMDVPVVARDDRGTTVVEGLIKLWISEKPPRHS